MPTDVRGDAEEFLADPKILERAVADITAAGVVGESRLTATLYLIGVSAQLPEAAIGNHSGPKCRREELHRRADGDVVPARGRLNATSLTTNALYYFPPGATPAPVDRRRRAVAPRRRRQAEATRALREMIEAGRLARRCRSRRRPASSPRR